MRTTDFKSGRLPSRMDYARSQVPHATLEINRTCNLGCRSCYNLDRTSIKSLDEIKAEADLLIQKRNLQVITVLGGEPTLHPELFEVIRYIKHRGLLCQLLTNGLILTQPGGRTYLDGLARARPDRVVVHLDRGQTHVHADLEAARRTIFDALEEKGLHFGLSLTIYNESSGEIAALARRYADYRFFDGILAILAREPLPPRTQTASLKDEYESLRSGLGLEPSAFVPSNLDDDDVNWLVYHYFLDAGSDETLGFSPAAQRLLRRLLRSIAGHEAFVLILPPRLTRTALVVLAAAESLLKPAEAVRRCVSVGKMLSGVPRLQFIAIQEPPKLDEQTRRMRICRNCLDATIRNGRLTPVCLADRMSPLPGFENPDKNARDWSPEVFRYMEGREVAG